MNIHSKSMKDLKLFSYYKFLGLMGLKQENWGEYINNYHKGVYDGIMYSYKILCDDGLSDEKRAEFVTAIKDLQEELKKDNKWDTKWDIIVTTAEEFYGGNK